MKLGKVFIGYTHDKKERCLYKKNVSYITDAGIVNATVYEDVETREEFDAYLVDEKSLIPYNGCLNVEKRRMTHRKVKKVYQMDRSKLIDVKGVFFGDLIDKNKLRNMVQDCDMFIDNETLDMNRICETKLKENCLFARTYDSEGSIEDLRNSQLYPMYGKVSVGVMARERRPIKYKQFDSQMQTKRKILEMDYKKRL